MLFTSVSREPNIKARILCLDDEPLGLSVRQMLLEQAGYMVFPATTGKQALQIFSEQDIDLVISDHLLQDTLGSQVAARMKRMNPGVPILILSGLPDPPEDIESADLFMCKLQPPPVFLQVVANLLTHAADKAA